MNKISTRTRWRGYFAGCAFAVCAMSISVPQSVLAQQRFKSPDEAAAALIAAVRSDKGSEIISVLGRDARPIVQSGDEVADGKLRAAFLLAYDLRHQVISDGQRKATLTIGNQDWPFPIPIVKRAGSWLFDTASGREEILYRRIGRNELSAVQVSLAFVDAENEYASINPEKTPVESYARRIISSPGKKDGLYWPASADQPKSPLGEAMAVATLEGYRLGGQPSPYHGYYYKVLTGQGASAPGGAVDYIINGQMIGGFALVAYPAEYGNSGVMTFLVNHSGVVFQKDLGPKTSRIASRMTQFNPDHTWKRVPAADLGPN